MTKFVDNLRKSVKAVMPGPVWSAMRSVFWGLLKFRYKVFGRPFTPGETSKAKTRRLREGFFEKFCRGSGLDIGYGGDPVVEGVRGWDFEHGNAQTLEGIADGEFDFVYTSHTLEHMQDPAEAVRNWWRVLKPRGHLIMYVPHRDLYEKKKTLPSRWNDDHKHFFLPDRDEEPDTIGMVPLVECTLEGYELIYARECSEGHTITDPEEHSDGEYSIEVVLRKKEASEASEEL